MDDRIGVWIVLAFSALFVLLAIVFLRKARARRRAMFAEETPPSAEDRELIAEAEGAALPAEPARLPEEAVEPDEEPPTEPEAEEEEAAAAPPAPAPKIDTELAKGLERTRAGFLGRLNALFARSDKLDPKVLDELEEILLTADVGVRLTGTLLGELRGELPKLGNGAAVRDLLKNRMRTVLASSGGDGHLPSGAKKPHVILFVGVNGVGKTTTIGKIAQKYRDAGRSVILAAADTFRAAAVEQLGIWAERTGAQIVKGDAGTDPASVVFNAIQKGGRDGTDIVLADTAGRLHTKTELMDEIKKVKRACGKARDGAPDETWLVVDATTGQNALQQAREFNETLGLSGVILTKLDGTAKGGVVLAIADALKIPVRFVGVGETAQDLRPFDPQGFVEALFG
jgi:fused signal recognition particle receptor